MSAAKTTILQKLTAHTSDVTSLDFYGNALLVTGSSDKTVRVWRWVAGSGYREEPFSPLLGHRYGVTSVRVSPKVLALRWVLLLEQPVPVRVPVALLDRTELVVRQRQVHVHILRLAVAFELFEHFDRFLERWQHGRELLQLCRGGGSLLPSLLPICRPVSLHLDERTGKQEQCTGPIVQRPVGKDRLQAGFQRSERLLRCVQRADAHQRSQRFVRQQLGEECFRRAKVLPAQRDVRELEQGQVRVVRVQVLTFGVRLGKPTTVEGTQHTDVMVVAGLRIPREPLLGVLEHYERVPKLAQMCQPYDQRTEHLADAVPVQLGAERCLLVLAVHRPECGPFRNAGRDQVHHRALTVEQIVDHQQPEQLRWAAAHNRPLPQVGQDVQRGGMEETAAGGFVRQRHTVALQVGQPGVGQLQTGRVAVFLRQHDALAQTGPGQPRVPELGVQDGQVQAGVLVILPFRCARRGGRRWCTGRRGAIEHALQRMHRAEELAHPHVVHVAEKACEQCGRSWMISFSRLCSSFGGSAFASFSFSRALCWAMNSSDCLTDHLAECDPWSEGSIGVYWFGGGCRKLSLSG
uniref:WD_REPEATS_REGION domain-containing protein n=1 Tax=Anopheles quadriannulatus TaxID=34691 RepID=A0A182X510_ANOQN